MAAEALHPEEVCRRCGGPNVSWSAPSPLWNAVMRGGSINGPQEFGELICPTCFCVLAEKRGVAVDWRVNAETVHVPLAFVTPSGRRWDPDRWLWVEDTTEVPPCPLCGADLSLVDRAGHLWDEHGTGDSVIAASSERQVGVGTAQRARRAPVWAWSLGGGVIATPVCGLTWSAMGLPFIGGLGLGLVITVACVDAYAGGSR